MLTTKFAGISLLEVVVAWLIDEHGWHRKRAATVLGLIIFLVGIPASLGYSTFAGFTFLGLDVLDSYDWFANSVFLPLGGLLSAIFVGYIWGVKNAQEEGNRNSGRIKIGAWFGFLIRYVIPLVILVIMITGILDTIRN